VEINVKDYGATGSGTTDDRNAIQAAIDAAPAGSTIVFPGGVNSRYKVASTIDVGKPLTLRSSSANATILSHTPIDSNERLFNVTASGVSFEDLIFDGTDAPPGMLTVRHVAIFFDGTRCRLSRLRVHNCDFVNLTRKGKPYDGQSHHADETPGNASLYSEYAVYVFKADGVWIERNRFAELSGTAVFVNNCTRVWVQFNDIGMLSTSDVLYHVHVEETCDRITIHGNMIHTGRRASGGAIDIMSINDRGGLPIKRVYITENEIENTPGFGSGLAVIRILSVEEGLVRGNIVRQIGDAACVYIYLDARTAVGHPDQSGLYSNIVSENILVAGAADQRGIDARNANAAGVGGDQIIIANNQLRTDRTNYFAAGIRARDISPIDLCGNQIDYKFSASARNSFGIEIAAVNVSITAPRVAHNIVNAYASASSRGIQIGGSGSNMVNEPLVIGNRVLDTHEFGIRLEPSANSPTIQNNICTGMGTEAISNHASGNSFQSGNRYNAAARVSCTWTIDTGANAVTIPTAEVRTGDRILLTITSNNNSDKTVKVSSIADRTNFTIKTIDGANVTAAMSGTWVIDH
jgi:hypothetical protein